MKSIHRSLIAYELPLVLPAHRVSPRSLCDTARYRDASVAPKFHETEGVQRMVGVRHRVGDFIMKHLHSHEERDVVFLKIDRSLCCVPLEVQVRVAPCRKNGSARTLRWESVFRYRKAARSSVGQCCIGAPL